MEETRISADCSEMDMGNQLVYLHMLMCLDINICRNPWKDTHPHEIVVVVAVDVAVGQKIDQKKLRPVK